ncbi:MAG: DNA-binding protein [Sulfuricurvum sp.]|uniref:DNA-binding protein n=1 Tax=Sulfuricurvum sp. TaxID=2025608 RepID=UPI0027375395|nr:DNA-binding protein [Sulfuricurvum sp.]MDP2850082.1 DNA-binding protein [Sulfuricurvum sp.]
MAKDLTNSSLERQNILNNPYAVQEIEKATNLQGVRFEDGVRFVKEQVADFFGIDIRTVERYLEAHGDELEHNGYEVLKGGKLQAFREAISAQFVTDIDVGSKVRNLGIFDFRSLLNISMLLTESETARVLRQTILDVVIDTINQRTGGGTKYINQRDEDFIQASFAEENYRKEFTNALRDHVDMGTFKYPLYTDKIYLSIFRENAKEYRKILKLHEKDNVRDTFYSEILDLIASFEFGFAKLIEESAKRKGSQLTSYETDHLYKEFESQAHWKPLIERARNKMASRDLAFRDALHQQLEEYITPVQKMDFERFLGEKSKELAERLEEAKDVFKRLKERK